MNKQSVANWTGDGVRLVIALSISCSYFFKVFERDLTLSAIVAFFLISALCSSPTVMSNYILTSTNSIWSWRHITRSWYTFRNKDIETPSGTPPPIWWSWGINWLIDTNDSPSVSCSLPWRINGQRGYVHVKVTYCLACLIRRHLFCTSKQLMYTFSSSFDLNFTLS